MRRTIVFVGWSLSACSTTSPPGYEIASGYQRGDVDPVLDAKKRFALGQMRRMSLGIIEGDQSCRLIQSKCNGSNPETPGQKIYFF